jgi:hypothetical protein
MRIKERYLYVPAHIPTATIFAETGLAFHGEPHIDTALVRPPSLGIRSDDEIFIGNNHLRRL